jgi:hypothetical protein
MNIYPDYKYRVILGAQINLLLSNRTNLAVWMCTAHIVFFDMAGGALNNLHIRRMEDLCT